MKKLFIGFVFSLLCVSVFAQETADVLVKHVTEDVLDIVRKDKDIQSGNTRKVIELVESKVLPHFNFQHMTALAVGKDWRKATPAQKQQLSNEFKTLLVRTYANAFSGYKNQKVVYKPFKASPGDEALVRTEVLQPGSKAIELDYSLERIEGAWKVFDVSVSGISLVTNYREQFANEIRNSGLDGLIETLSAKNKSLEAAIVAKADKK
jgi:phospholipid transport system substrate-binding protein